MHSYNQSGFILVGFVFCSGMQTALFLLFLLVYTMSLFANLSIITVIWLDHQLHIPMYYFIGSLACLDICFISSTAPKLLSILASDNRAISHTACILQLYVYMSFGTTEFFLLAIMSADRYMAICHPLRYNSVVTGNLCISCILIAWVSGFLVFLYPINIMFNLSFCDLYEINHFFCDSSAIVKISCSDTKLFDSVFSTFASSIVLGSFIITLVSYIHILYAVTKIQSSQGKKRVYSTCASHFTAVSLVYGSVIIIYVGSIDSCSPDLNKIIAIFNSFFIPMLNPFIYSLRNKKVQKALWGVMKNIAVQ